MRKDTSFGDRKLTREEFSAKYWKGGDPNYLYQYHTMGIEDGRDEREQLLINNIRALWNLLRASKSGHIEVTAPEVQLQGGVDPKMVARAIVQNRLHAKAASTTLQRSRDQMLPLPASLRVMCKTEALAGVDKEERWHLVDPGYQPRSDEEIVQLLCDGEVEATYTVTRMPPSESGAPPTSE